MIELLLFVWLTRYYNFITKRSEARLALKTMPVAPSLWLTRSFHKRQLSTILISEPLFQVNKPKQQTFLIFPLSFIILTCSHFPYCVSFETGGVREWNFWQRPSHKWHLPPALSVGKDMLYQSSSPGLELNRKYAVLSDYLNLLHHGM